ncbi:MAG: class A beta-lactamase, partial [Caulobacteraceae bacterium]
FNYCSTFKLFLAAATLERAQRGDERLDRAVAISSGDLVSHAPVTGAAVGGHLTIQDLCQATVEVSDNPAANILIREMGGLDAWRGWLRSIGDADTTIDRLEPGLNVPDGAKDTAHVDQTVTNLQAVLKEGRLDQAHSALLRRWLVDSPTGAGRIKAGAPVGWTVAHKTGTGGGGQVNDIGLLEGPNGQRVFLAIYYDGPSDKPAAEADAVVAEATRISLRAIGHV